MLEGSDRNHAPGGGAGSHHVVVGRLLLQHQPHRLDIIAGMAPVALGVHVAERQRVGEAKLDACYPVGDLAGHELDTAEGLSWLKRMPDEACSPKLSR